jgi:hypothetical protein
MVYSIVSEVAAAPKDNVFRIGPKIRIIYHNISHVYYIIMYVYVYACIMGIYVRLCAYILLFRKNRQKKAHRYSWKGSYSQEARARSNRSSKRFTYTKLMELKMLSLYCNI